MTGDGTNDAPALKESHVGLSMGRTGTEVAKEASDIVILDDNFKSIVKSVLWGRSVFNNIRKFLQFQITINFVALNLAFIAALVSTFTERDGLPLNVLQLLWVNLIMDSMAALALATEDPTPELLLAKPNGPDEPLINKKMWKHIVTQGLFQLKVLLVLLYGLPEMDKYHIVDCGDEPKAADVCADVNNCPNWSAIHAAYDACEDLKEDNERRVNSVVFNTFIIMQLFNQLNARKINDEVNVFQGVADSKIFLYVVVGIACSQVLIMETPVNTFFKVDSHQNGVEWAIAVVAGFCSWPVAALVKLLTAGPTTKVAPATE